MLPHPDHAGREWRRLASQEWRPSELAHDFGLMVWCQCICALANVTLYGLTKSCHSMVALYISLPSLCG